MLMHQGPTTPEDHYDPSLQHGFIDLRQSGYDQYARPHWHYPSPPMSNSTPPSAITQARSLMPPSPAHSGYEYPAARQTIDLSGVMPSYHHMAEPHPQILPIDTRSLHLVAAAQRPVDLTSSNGPFITSTPQNFQPPAQAHRRTKSHVASACVNCKKAHLACDVRRPCPRCVGLGKQDTCKDVQHKKRGRPRLRDERHCFEVEPNGQIQSAINISSGSESSQSSGRKSRAGNGRSLQYDPDATRSYSGQHIEIPLKLKIPNQPLTAFLTVDLVITFSSDSFQDYVGFNHIHLHRVRSLFDLVSASDVEKLQRLCNRIKYDMKEIDPSYVIPNINATIGTIERLKLEEVTMATQGSRRFEESLDIYRSDGQAMRTNASFTLARRGVFFIFLEFSNPATTYAQMGKVSPISPQTSHFSRRSSSLATDSSANYQYQGMMNGGGYQPTHTRKTSMISQGQPIPVQSVDLYTPRVVAADNALPSFKQYDGSAMAYTQPNQAMFEAQTMATTDFFPTARTTADTFHLPPLRTSQNSVDVLDRLGNKRARIGVSEMLG